VADESRVIFGVNEGEFALGEGNSSEGVTISQPAIKEKGPERYALEVGVDF
jgi:hypothetical protein